MDAKAFLKQAQVEMITETCELLAKLYEKYPNDEDAKRILETIKRLATMAETL